MDFETVNVIITILLFGAVVHQLWDSAGSIASPSNSFSLWDWLRHNVVRIGDLVVLCVFYGLTMYVCLDSVNYIMLLNLFLLFLYDKGQTFQLLYKHFFVTVKPLITEQECSIAIQSSVKLPNDITSAIYSFLNPKITFEPFFIHDGVNPMRHGFIGKPDAPLGTDLSVEITVDEDFVNRNNEYKHELTYLWGEYTKARGELILTKQPEKCNPFASFLVWSRTSSLGVSWLMLELGLKYGNRQGHRRAVLIDTLPVQLKIELTWEYSSPMFTVYLDGYRVSRINATDPTWYESNDPFQFLTSTKVVFTGNPDLIQAQITL